MKIRNGLKHLIKSTFHSLGFEVTRKQPLAEQPLPESTVYRRNEHMQGGLERCKSIIPQINTVIDLGAAQGRWSLSAIELWPNAEYLLFEPLEERKSELEALLLKYSNFHFIPAAGGREKGEINFYIASDLDGSGIAHEAPANNVSIRKVRVTSVDDEVRRHQLKGPYLVKLDTHGFEVPILEGCSGILQEVSVFVIECYGFQIVDNSLLFWEMCQYMDRLGFRLIDIVDVMHRPQDGAFWQCDAFFIKKDNPIFRYASYIV